MVAGSGCSLASADGDSPVRTEVEVSGSVLRLGDTLRVSVHVINEGDGPIIVETNGCNFHFRVFTISGAEAGPAEDQACLAYSRPRTVDVGGRYTWTGIWTGRSGGGAAVPEFVSAGRYRIVGRPLVLNPDVTFARGSAIIEVVD